MPLNRENMTVASFIMTKAYVVFFAVFGASLMVTPLDRLLATPMLRYAHHIMSIRAWGAMFFACGLLMVVALVRERRMLYRYGLLVCGLSMATWTLVALVGIFFEPISYSAWVWPAFVMAACWATNKSLEKGERDQRRVD